MGKIKKVQKKDDQFNDDKLEENIKKIQQDKELQKNNGAIKKKDPNNIYGNLKMQKQPMLEEKSPETIQKEEQELQIRLQKQRELNEQRKLQKIQKQEEKKKKDRNEEIRQRIQGVKEYLQEQKEITIDKQISGNKDLGKLVIGLFFFAVFLVGFKYQEINYNKQKRIQDKNQGQLEVNLLFQENIYEIFEIPSIASQSEIRTKYRELVKQWHPDKNPDCGKTCDVKFQKISLAYDILRDPAKRQDYDNNSGAVNKLKSQAIEINEQNFKSLILDKDDIWIIQIYEDVDDESLHIADAWESIVRDYKGSLKFGRIHFEDSALQLLPVKITVVPTIISWDGKQDIDFFQINEQIYERLSQFIESKIPVSYQIIPFEDIQNLNQKEKNQIILHKTERGLSAQDKYKIFKNQELVDVSILKWTDLQILNTEQNKEKVYGTTIINKKSFDFPRNSQQNQLELMMNFIKYNSLISINLENIDDLCIRNNEQSTLCIFVMQNHEQILSESIQHTIITYQDQVFKASKQDKKWFENYDYLQFFKLNPQQHFRFKNLIKKISLVKKIDLNIIKAISYDPKRQTLSFIYDQQFDQFQETIDAILDQDYDYFIQLQDYIDHDLSNLFSSKDYGFASSIFYTFFNQLLSFRMLFLLGLCYLGYTQFIDQSYSHSVIFLFQNVLSVLGLFHFVQSLLMTLYLCNDEIFQ